MQRRFQPLEAAFLRMGNSPIVTGGLAHFFLTFHSSRKYSPASASYTVSGASHEKAAKCRMHPGTPIVPIRGISGF